jgi:FemAB-related protein (PEP-CTERM system-associated)
MENVHCSVRLFTIRDAPDWDSYVESHPAATVYHLSGWKNIIEDAYGHKTYFLICEIQTNPSGPKSPGGARKITGVLPLVHIKNLVFGNSLISMPFLDYGGILADDGESENALLAEALKIGQELKVSHIELRHIEPLSGQDSFDADAQVSIYPRSHKVCMHLDLPEDFDILIRSFKSKLRSQIGRPLKSGLRAEVGHMEHIDHFYNVFSINMRDLGSPVHSIRLMRNVMEKFSDRARFCVVFKEKQPVAASLILGFKDTLENPWASSLREYKHMSPNMLLYRTMLEYGCERGFCKFDFGRSSPDEGTFKFKNQWGAKAKPLHWYYISLKEQSGGREHIDKSRFSFFINYWQKLPVCLTKVIGPQIRKHISL